MEKVKITFSKYCCSGFYGEKCICKRCCKQQKKQYDETEELKNWVFAQVMTGEPFIVENVKPAVVFESGKPVFGKILKFLYNGEALKI